MKLTTGKVFPVIVFLAALLYVNSLHHEFVYDDVYIITENYFIKTFANFPKFFTKEYLPLSGELSYRPLVTLTYFIDYALWGENPIGYHLTNIVLHTANVSVFFLFLQMVFKKLSTSILCALIFLSHPVLTETVNAVCYREDILASLFVLLAFVFFLKGKNTERPGTGHISCYILSCISYCLALFSKEMAITLPFLLLLFDFLFFRKNTMGTVCAIPVSFRILRIVYGYAGYFFTAGFYLFIRFITFKNTFKEIEVSPGKFTTVTKIVASYLKLLFIPVWLNADYYVSHTTILSPSFILSFFCIISLGIITMRFYKTHKLLLFFIAWFFITLLPVLGIIPIGNSMAERYLYIPVTGFCCSAGYLLSNYSFRKWSLILLGLVLFLLQIGIVYRNGIWRDEATLWHHTYKREPQSARACSNLGNIYFNRGQLENALHMYNKSLALPYSYPFIHYNLGATYEKMGQIDKALEEYKVSLSNLNENTLAYNNMGSLYNKQGSYTLAIESFKKALRSNPYFPVAHNNLGNAYERMEETEMAITEYREAIKIDSTYADAHNNLGAMYLKKGMTDLAIDELEQACHFMPEHVDAYYNLGVAHAAKGQYEKAIQTFQRSISNNPNDYSAYRDLGILFYKFKDDKKQALHYLNKALHITPRQEETKRIKDIINRISSE
ncbi:MAG: tetratricopeptide repeat protein [Candidatus Brocadiaceae bacterium]|nr:tetratricopeptide repeat protein [Candidatus Brocadiaceae bacterium]